MRPPAALSARAIPSPPLRHRILMPARSPQAGVPCHQAEPPSLSSSPRQSKHCGGKAAANGRVAWALSGLLAATPGLGRMRRTERRAAAISTQRGRLPTQLPHPSPQPSAVKKTGLRLSPTARRLFCLPAAGAMARPPGTRRAGHWRGSVHAPCCGLPSSRCLLLPLRRFRAPWR